MLILGLQVSAGLVGSKVAVAESSGSNWPGSAVSSGLSGGAGGGGRVTVGAISKVGVGSPPAGVGEDSGVTKMFGVGVGGFSRSGGSVGATLRLT